MESHTCPKPRRVHSEERRKFTPESENAFMAFSKEVFRDGALSARMKQCIAVAVAHVTQCPYCIRSHTKAAMRAGCTPEEIMESIWVAAEMRAGAAVAHSMIALDTLSNR